VARWTGRPIRVAPGSLKVDRDLEWSPSLEFLRNLIERTGNRNESERFTGRLHRQVIPFPIPPSLDSRIQRRRGIKGGYLGLSFALSYFACCSCFALLAACCCAASRSAAFPPIIDMSTFYGNYAERFA
jgi:hypothetical protein